MLQFGALSSGIDVTIKFLKKKMKILEGLVYHYKLFFYIVTQK